MLDAYVRKLVDTHEHLVRQFKAKVARVYTWQECYDDPQSLATRQRSQSSLWKYPSDCFALYKSATIHTMQAKVPKRLLVIPLLVVVAAVLAVFAYRSVHSIAKGAHATSPAAQAEPSTLTGAAPALTDAAYVSRLAPRVAGMPWSAPLFDDRKPKAEPEILCVMSEAKGCQCYTEQITRLEVPILQCFQIAKYGVYNPYREPMRSTSTAARSESRDQPSLAADYPRPLSGEGGGLKAGATPGESASETWPRPDFSYKVPFPESH